MKKIKIMPIWKLEVLEEWFEGMELDGYRLEKVKFGFLYYFKQSAPKKTKYFSTVINIRGISMFNWSNMLLVDFSATEINTVFSQLSLFRITKEKDMKMLIEARLSFIKRLVLEYLLTLGFLLLFSIFCLLLNKIVGAILLVVIIPLFVYYLYGYFFQINKIKKYNSNR